MTHRLLFVVMLTTSVAAVGRAQEPITIAGLRALFVGAWTTSAAIDTLNVRILDVSGRGRALAADFAKHNAEPCEYPQGHPELCANYDRERMDLNLRVADLQKEWRGYEAERKPLRAHFATLMARLRDASYAGAAASWRDAMVACSNVNGVSEAAACLTDAATRHR
jgi:hypothetical protein